MEFGRWSCVGLECVVFGGAALDERALLKAVEFSSSLSAPRFALSKVI